MVAVVFEILSYIQLELFEKDRQIAKLRLRLGLALHKARTHGIRGSRNIGSWRCVAVTMFRRSPRAARRSTGLLYDVCEFVRQKFLARACPGRKLSRAKDHVRSHRVCQSADRMRRRRGLRVGMHAHMGKIMSETSSEESLRRRVQRLPRALEHTY